MVYSPGQTQKEAGKIRVPLCACVCLCVRAHACAFAKCKCSNVFIATARVYVGRIKPVEERCRVITADGKSK